MPLTIVFIPIDPGAKSDGTDEYEVWASDQSNSVPGQTALGVKGSWLWAWDSKDILMQLKGRGDAVPLSCSPVQAHGPYDILKVPPGSRAV
jgi:hypothetical protein